MKYIFKVAYKGTNYLGWQRQATGISVQETLETVLRKFLGEKVNFIGCGRTDAGVHAKGYFGHLVSRQAIDQEALFVLNKMLPDDIALLGFCEAPGEFHAQHSAVERTYEYHIHTRVDPFKAETSFYYDKKMDLDLLQFLESSILASDNFIAFCKKPDKITTHNCRVGRSKWEQTGEDTYKYTISSNRFLRGMVRLLVGTMLAVNEEKMHKKGFEGALFSGIRPEFQFEAFPQGLCLQNVSYGIFNHLPVFE